MQVKMNLQGARAFADTVERRTQPFSRDPWMEAIILLNERIKELEGENGDRGLKGA